MPGYQSDLAYIHDVGFGDSARRAAPALLALLRRHGVRKGLVVDVGCGSGIWARALTDAGYDALGVDTSPAMLERARRNAPHARFVRASFFSHPVPACDAVTAMGEVLNYLFDRRNTSRELARFFGNVYAALRPGGVFIFDVAEPGRGKAAPACRYVASDAWAILLDIRENARSRLLTRHMTLFVKAGKLFRRSEEVHRLRLYPRAEIIELLQAAGFEVSMLRGYGRSPFPPGIAGFVARKPRSAEEDRHHS